MGGIGALGDLGREGVMGMSLLKGWASSSVGRHSEQWIALESDGKEIRGMVGKTTPSFPLSSWTGFVDHRHLLAHQS